MIKGRLGVIVLILILMVFSTLLGNSCGSRKDIYADRRYQDFKDENQGPFSVEEAEEYLKVSSLRGIEIRKRAVDLFEKLAQKYPTYVYASRYREMAKLLRKMVEEDKAWQEVADVSKLSLNEQIDYYIYKLRDTHGVPTWRVGYGGFYILSGDSVANRLVAIGEPAISALINLLNDPRPIAMTLSTGSMGPVRILQEPGSQEKVYDLPRGVYRYQDAARDIIVAIKSKWTTTPQCPDQQYKDLLKDYPDYLPKGKKK